MSKQVHIRLDDAVFEALSRYNDDTNTSLQDAITVALTQFLTRELREATPDSAEFTFIDLCQCFL